MLAFVHIGIIALLLLLATQDVLHRAVSWFIFPLLLILAIGKYQLVTGDLKTLLRPTLLNGLFIGLQLLLLQSYLSLKEKKWIDLTANHLGTGDMLFFLVSVFFFSSLNFLLFYLFSLAVVLLMAIVAGWTGGGKRTVPLAGWQAMILALVYGLDVFIDKFSMLSDHCLITLLASGDNYL